MARVLLVGYIPELLQERDRALRAAGHTVTIGPSFAAASDAIAQENFEVAVLGFSVPEAERNQLARILKESSPSTRLIMIYFTSVKNTELADALLPTTATAEDILRAVNHIISKNREKQA
jgi:DNA-binding NtrC family response regulator